MKDVNVKMVSSPDKVFLGETRELYLQVNFDATEPKDIGRKVPMMNLALVIDRSSSMTGDSIENVKTAAIQFVNSLRGNDIISIVAYDSVVDVILKPTKVGKNRDRIREAINSLYTRGMTDLCEGVLTGLELVKSKFDEQMINRVILFSDGLANVGLTGIESINSAVFTFIAGKNISVTTLGVGADFDEVLMQSLASTTRGNYYYIENADFIPNIVERELTGLKSLLWRNLELEFQSPGVGISEVYGYTAKGNKTFVGDVRALDELYVIAKCDIPIDMGYGIVNVIFRYDDVYNNESNLEFVKQFKIKTTNNINKVKEDLQILTNLELFYLGEYIEKARKLMSSRDFDQAVSIIRDRKLILSELWKKNPSDERIGLKLTFLNKMESEAKNGAYSKKFAKMSSYYSYSAGRQNYRKKISSKYSR